MGKHYAITDKRVRRKSKKDKPQRSVNKYAHLVPTRPQFYNSRNKTFRELPVIGDRAEVLKSGYRMVYHGRLYELMNNTTIPATAPLVLGTTNKYQGIGQFKLVNHLD